MDGNGVERARLSAANGEKGPTLLFSDADGRFRAELSLVRGEPVLAFLNRKREIRAMVSYRDSDDSGVVGLGAVEGAGNMIGVAASRDGVGFTATGPGKAGASLGVGADGNSYLFLLDRQGKSTAHLP